MAAEQDEDSLYEGDRFGEALPDGVSLVLAEIDWREGICRFVRSDGKEAIIPDPSILRPLEKVIVKSTYFFNANFLMLETARGETIGAELPTVNSHSPINGRPVIYLDQKDWSTLSNALQIGRAHV